MKLDILVLAAHPDDAELSCSGTIISHLQKGYKVGIVDFTRGEMGTRGTPEIRKEESMEASKIMGLTIRENLELEDVFFSNTLKDQLKVIQAVRKYRPDMVLANAIADRHPDHGKAAKLAVDACFMAGLKKIKTTYNNQEQEAWRPKVVYHFIQNVYVKPDLIVDVSDVWDKKIEAIKAFKSQFYNPESTEELTYISTPEFLPFVDARGREMGHAIGKKFGEGFTVNRFIGVQNLFDLI